MSKLAKVSQASVHLCCFAKLLSALKRAGINNGIPIARRSARSLSLADSLSCAPALIVALRSTTMRALKRSSSFSGVRRDPGKNPRVGVKVLMRGADRKGAWACCAAYSPSWTKPHPSGMLGTLSSSNRTGSSRDCVTNWRATKTYTATTAACIARRRLAASERAPETAVGGRAPGGRRQAAPFAKDRSQSRGGRPGRRPVRAMAGRGAARVRRGSTRPWRRRRRRPVRTAAARSQ